MDLEKLRCEWKERVIQFRSYAEEPDNIEKTKFVSININEKNN